jgi:hypothetical protein
MLFRKLSDSLTVVIGQNTAERQWIEDCRALRPSERFQGVGTLSNEQVPDVQLDATVAGFTYTVEG